MKRNNLILAGVFAVLIVLAIAIPKGNKQGAAPGGPGAAAGQGKAAGKVAGKAAGASATVFRITSVLAAVQDLHSYLEINGDVEADNTVAMYPDISGKLVSLRANLGSKVGKGEIIAEIDPSKPGANYSLSPVYAPISGTVTSIPVKVGSTVSTSTVIAVIGDIGNLQVTARIPEREIAVLKTGLPAEITFEAYPGLVFAATVFRVSPLVDSTSRTKEIYLSFVRDDARINAGMFASIKLYTTVSENCVAVPDEAVVTSYDKDYVFIVNGDSTVTKREVTKGVSVDGACQIVSGLAGGERVAYEGVSVLSDGVTVKDISKTSETKPALEAAPDGGNQ